MSHTVNPPSLGIAAMGYRSLAECVRDLQATGQLVVIDDEVDPYLEAAAIQRRVYQAGGPALLFRRVKGTEFPLAGNLFGTLERCRYLFRDSLESVRRLVELKVNPGVLAKNPLRFAGVPRTVWRLFPKRVRSGPILAHHTTIDRLPQVQCWPLDGGPFITLPQVYTEDPNQPGLAHSNLGMYRIQLAGNQYVVNQEVGLHYQIQRGIGVHHAAAIQRGEPLRVSVSVGGPPSLTLAAVMPLPEGMPELSFAGVLGGHRIKLVTTSGGFVAPAEADFAISGVVDPFQRKPEGPFGDHLGYYSLQHDFPVLQVKRVYHCEGAIWPFTSVGRPPQEDTSFGALIHELTGPVLPTLIPGLHAVHAVDAAGVHPLLLAIASERYEPYERVRRPQEILMTANALLGQGQLSLAKYVLIVAREDAPELDIHDVRAFVTHLLQRVDWATDLHFQTQTTIDTLDYSGHGLNRGSKVVIAAAGPPRRTLATELPRDIHLPEGFRNPQVVQPGILAVSGPPCREKYESADLPTFCQRFGPAHAIAGFPLVVVVDDSEFTAAHERNFLWITFTRSDPAADIDGIGAFIEKKHWGCSGPLVIDARLKPRHAPPLVDDPDVERRADRLAAPGGPLHGIY
jgi:4-hydroxy-3-polyprenylbenzoate decarboxylase